MPKVDSKRINRNIQMYCKREDITLSLLAKKVGLGDTTFLRKRKSGKWMLYEMMLISDALREPIENIFIF